jgi:hypothetical protein
MFCLRVAASAGVRFEFITKARSVDVDDVPAVFNAIAFASVGRYCYLSTETDHGIQTMPAVQGTQADDGVLQGSIAP